MKTRCLIVDDEPLAVEAVKMHVDKIDALTLIDTCTDVMEAFDVLQKTRIDLIFLDIEMPEMTGLDFLKTIRNPPKVIFTTAYRDYALEAFDLEVVDYLLKPISFDRFLMAVNRYFERAEPIVVGSESSSKMMGSNHFFVKADKKNVKIINDTVLYIESIKDYVKIVCRNKTIISKIMIGQLIDLLPETLFLRIHRSYIVYIPNVEAYSAVSVEVPGKELPIGRNYKQEVMQTLAQL